MLRYYDAMINNSTMLQCCDTIIRGLLQHRNIKISKHFIVASQHQNITLQHRSIVVLQHQKAIFPKQQLPVP